jgi:hypothetical protein
MIVVIAGLVILAIIGILWHITPENERKEMGLAPRDQYKERK